MEQPLQPCECFLMNAIQLNSVLFECSWEVSWRWVSSSSDLHGLCISLG